MHRLLRPLLLALLALTAVLSLAACGSSDDGNGAAQSADPKPTARAEDFPSAKGRTLPDIIANLPEGPILAPSVSVLDKGTNRIGFALFDKARKQLSGAGVALYIGNQD